MADSLSTQVPMSQRSDALFRLLVESVRDYAIFVLDPDGRVLTWNAGAQTLVGYSREGIMGKHFSIFYLPESVQSNWPSRELELAEKEGRFADEGWRVRKDGSTFWASVTMTALHDENGHLTGFAEIIQDMTERRMAAERIHALNRELREKVAQLDESKKNVELRTLELQNLSARVLSIQDQERRRVARELHDDLGQQLAALKMVTSKMKNLEAMEMIDSAISSVRNLSYLLHPPLLEEAGLQAALHWFVEGVSKRSNIDVTLLVRPTGFPRLTDELETALYRVIQEALMNVVRHSGSKSARIEIDRQSEWITVRVRDYGSWTMTKLPETSSQSTMGVGIAGMRERLRQFGGELRVTAAEPGTLVEAKVPFFA
jgi:PAS domain S-box-containing protein